MTNQNNAAQAAEQAIKAAIRKAYDDGYNDAKMAPDNCSTYCVERAVRLDSAALLSKLRAPVSDIREGFELAYAADADDPACAADLSHFTNGWRACIMSQVRAPVADSTLPLEQALYELVNKIDTGLDTGDLLQDARRASTVLDAIMTSGDLVACAHTFFKECGEDKWRERYERSLDFRIGWNTCLDAIAEAQANRAASVASAPVAKPKRAPLDDWRVQAIAECLETEWDDMTPAGAEADARLIVGYLIEYEKESGRIEAKHAAEPVEPIVQAIRSLPASAPVAGEAVACLRRQREGSDWGHWTPATVEDGQRVTGLRSWQVRWLVDATPEAIADGLTVEIRLPNGTNISGWMKMASQAHLSAAPVECPPVAGERAFQLVQDLRAFAAMQRWFGEHGYDSVGASGRLAVSNALFSRLCAALSAQPAEKPATSAPSPAASQRQAMVPGSQESGNSHTDGGAVYA